MSIAINQRLHPREYRAWINMRARCNNRLHQEYRNYGGRGIVVCEQWDSFENFLADLGKAPQDYQLERVKNHEGYTPDNCVWATRKQQSLNRRTTRMVTFSGQTMCLSDWARHLGMPKHTLFSRINIRGWTVEQALTTPVHKNL